MDKENVTLLFAGDLLVGTDPDKYFQGVNEMLAGADLRVAQLETAYSATLSESAPPDRNVKVLESIRNKFDAVALCGNHFFDHGESGVEDTIKWLDDNNIGHFGGGVNIDLANQPIVIEKKGVKFGFIGFNALGPKSSFASENKGGTSYVNFYRTLVPVSEDVSRHENDIYDYRKPYHEEGDFMYVNFPDMKSYMEMSDRIQALRPKCDVLCVYFHKGLVHRPVEVAEYERFISRVAIDAGADVVFASHSHLLRGVEIYRGKTIYHGLNNFILWNPGLSPHFKGKDGEHTAFPNGAEWKRKRVERFGFVPDPEYPTYPFHPESIYSAVAKCVIRDGKIVETSLIPMIIRKDGAPYVVPREGEGQVVFDYIDSITRGADLNAVYQWRGDEIIISEAEKQ